MNRSPEAARTAALLESQYARRFDAQAQYRNDVWRVLTSRFFQRYVSAGDRILDLGCGYGQFINHIVAREKYAMDLNPQSRAAVASGIAFFEQDCSLPWPLEDESLDVVFTSNFLEHLPAKSSIEATLAQVRRCLRPGGRLIALGPNIRFTAGTYWDFWDHHVALSDRSLREILDLSGFETVASIERFLPYTMAQKRPPPVAFVRWYLRMPLVWRVFGHQFLIVASKR